MHAHMAAYAHTRAFIRAHAHLHNYHVSVHLQWEYGFASTLSIGVAIFMYSKADVDDFSETREDETSFAGVMCLLGYMALDR